MQCFSDLYLLVPASSSKVCSRQGWCDEDFGDRSWSRGVECTGMCLGRTSYDYACHGIFFYLLGKGNAGNPRAIMTQCDPSIHWGGICSVTWSTSFRTDLYLNSSRCWSWYIIFMHVDALLWKQVMHSVVRRLFVSVSENLCGLRMGSRTFMKSTQALSNYNKGGQSLVMGIVMYCHVLS